MFSKACEYGIKAVIYIAMQSLRDVRVKMGDIVENIGSPEAFTGKILSMLTKNGIVDSYTGPNGGFEMKPEHLHLITVADIVKAIDGDEFFHGCVLGLARCDKEHPCPMHHTVDKIRTSMRTALHQTSVFELTTKLKNRKSILIK